MIIVAGQLLVDPAERDAYLTGCVPVIEGARSTARCLDFALTADPVDTAIRSASVAEYDVAAVRSLT